MQVRDRQGYVDSIRSSYGSSEDPPSCRRRSLRLVCRYDKRAREWRNRSEGARATRGGRRPEKPDFGAEQIEAYILESPGLRAVVPRLYGLGDLSEILDERAYEQARAILDWLKLDLVTFVVTDTYAQAERALELSGLLLLVGPPGLASPPSARYWQSRPATRDFGR